jgi:plastocyanin
VVGLGAALAVGCGGSSSTSSGQTASGFTITIASMAFAPLGLAVPPGATVTVVNRDSMAHSVTSEAAPNAFTPGAVSGVSFDTGPFTGTRTITIPANAPEGAVIPYYCTVHGNTMATPNGTITIHAAARPAPSPGGGGGGY